MPALQGVEPALASILLGVRVEALTWITGLLGAGGAVTAAAYLGLLPSLVAAVMALLRGAIDILLDLAGCAAGRYVLIILAAVIACGYCYHAGQIHELTVNKHEVKSIVNKCPQVDDPLSIFDIFKGN